MAGQTGPESKETFGSDRRGPLRPHVRWTQNHLDSWSTFEGQTDPNSGMERYRLANQFGRPFTTLPWPPWTQTRDQILDYWEEVRGDPSPLKALSFARPEYVSGDRAGSLSGSQDSRPGSVGLEPEQGTVVVPRAERRSLCKNVRPLGASHTVSSPRVRSMDYIESTRCTGATVQHRPEIELAAIRPSRRRLRPQARCGNSGRGAGDRSSCRGLTENPAS